MNIMDFGQEINGSYRHFRFNCLGLVIGIQGMFLVRRPWWERIWVKEGLMESEWIWRKADWMLGDLQIWQSYYVWRSANGRISYVRLIILQVWFDVYEIYVERKSSEWADWTFIRTLLLDFSIDTVQVMFLYKKKTIDLVTLVILSIGVNMLNVLIWLSVLSARHESWQLPQQLRKPLLSSAFWFYWNRGHHCFLGRLFVCLAHRLCIRWSNVALMFYWLLGYTPLFPLTYVLGYEKSFKIPCFF